MKRELITVDTARVLVACEAGASIKPGVERGFASETPGQEFCYTRGTAMTKAATKAYANYD